jgi:hypothetical protein
MPMLSEPFSSLFSVRKNAFTLIYCFHQVNENSFMSLGEIKLIHEPLFFHKKNITLMCSNEDKLFFLNQINAVLNEAVQLIESS